MSLMSIFTVPIGLLILIVSSVTINLIGKNKAHDTANNMEKISIKTKELRKAAITMESKMASKIMVMMMAKLSHLKDDLMQVEDWAFTFFLFFGLRKNATIGD